MRPCAALAMLLCVPSLARAERISAVSYDDGTSYASVSTEELNLPPDEAHYVYEPVTDTEVWTQAPTEEDGSTYSITENGEWVLSTSCEAWLQSVENFRPQWGSCRTDDLDVAEWNIAQAYEACELEDPSGAWTDRLRDAAEGARADASTCACEAQIDALWTYGYDWDTCTTEASTEVEDAIKRTYLTCQMSTMYNQAPTDTGTTWETEDIWEFYEELGRDDDIDTMLASLNNLTLPQAGSGQEWWEIYLGDGPDVARQNADICACFGASNELFNTTPGQGDTVDCDPGDPARIERLTDIGEATCPNADPYGDWGSWDYFQYAQDYAWTQLETCAEQASGMCDLAIDAYWRETEDLRNIVASGCSDPSYYVRKEQLDEALNALIQTCDASGWSISQAQMDRANQIYYDAMMLNDAACNTWDAVASRCQVSGTITKTSGYFGWWVKENEIQVYNYKCPTWSDVVQCMRKTPQAELYIQKSFWVGRENHIATHVCTWVDPSTGVEMPHRADGGTIKMGGSVGDVKLLWADRMNGIFAGKRNYIVVYPHENPYQP